MIREDKHDAGCTSISVVIIILWEVTSRIFIYRRDCGPRSNINVAHRIHIDNLQFMYLMRTSSKLSRFSTICYQVQV